MTKQKQLPTFLAFASDSASVETLKNFLGALKLDKIEVKKGTIHDAIHYLKENRSPRYLIVDLSDSSMPLSDAHSLADVCENSTEVIAIGMNNDVGLYRDLLTMGIHDYIVKPLNDNLISQALSGLPGLGAQESLKSSRMGKIVAFLGCRGGVGTTTLAANTAWLLSEERAKRVLFLDLDLHFGASSLFFDVSTEHGLKEALENPQRIDSLFLERSLISYSERLQLLGSEEPLKESGIYPAKGLEECLPFLLKQYHYIIVDVPRVFTPVTLKALEAAAAVILVGDPSITSMREFVRIQEFFDEVKPSSFVLRLINKVGAYKKGELGREEISKALGQDPDFFLPYDPIHPLEALNLGMPFVKQASSLRDETLKFIDHLSGAKNTEKEEGLLSSLVRRFF